MAKGRVGSVRLPLSKMLVQEQGQATVEAAFLLPVLFCLVLLLLQPGIVLYDRMVMKEAAAEGCRVLTTTVSGSDQCESYVKRRLGAVPMQDNFHMHSGSCSWDISTKGNASSETVSVTIQNKLKLLPLIDVGLGLFGIADSEGCLNIEVTASQRTQPDWVQSSPAGASATGWVGAWLS